MTNKEALSVTRALVADYRTHEADCLKRAAQFNPRTARLLRSEAKGTAKICKNRAEALERVVELATRAK